MARALHPGRGMNTPIPNRRAGGEDEHPEKPGDNPQIDPPREPGQPPIQKDPPPPEPPRELLRRGRDGSWQRVTAPGR
jgi:hypothetical protein